MQKVTEYGIFGPGRLIPIVALFVGSPAPIELPGRYGIIGLLRKIDPLIFDP